MSPYATVPYLWQDGEQPRPTIVLGEMQKDFLSLNPLSDEELNLQERMVWYSKGLVGCDFQSNFLSAFLMKMYWQKECEHEFKVRMRVSETFLYVLFFFFFWKPDITEEAVIKFILRNINPRMASQLRSRVNTVEELVRLGQELEKEKLSQTQYDQWKKPLSKQKDKSTQTLSQPSHSLTSAQPTTS